MIREIKSLNEITTAAIDILCKELGIANTVRFINQFSSGYGNYTEDRKQMFNDMTLNEIVSDIKKTKI